eukprot:CAMPEP_0205862784 /NCGR_PEP_ID=MMETSP1083-20121108/6484_1 /ASSEMBLY_ACC=CAM_ASM_000430 /TAXON_ID=97485 /ORGANISM="Prymnesium parvum, Strain Texoma1" /LENGTH=140 /DNA_ID=CAMNT_0053224571 /DNA_START=159 /DNA_END=577 /DNA_ORIENTATION=+
MIKIKTSSAREAVRLPDGVPWILVADLPLAARGVGVTGEGGGGGASPAAASATRKRSARLDGLEPVEVDLCREAAASGAAFNSEYRGDTAETYGGGSPARVLAHPAATRQSVAATSEWEEAAGWEEEEQEAAGWEEAEGW